MEAFSRNCGICPRHYRTIIFIQMDLLSKIFDTNKPIAQILNQKVVACNQAARQFGVFEGMPLTTAVTFCPDIVSFNVVDRQLEWRNTVDQVNNFLRSYTPDMERMDMEQCFLQFIKFEQDKEDLPSNRLSCCDCGYYMRLTKGHRLAGELQKALKAKFNVSSRIGVSYTKTLARAAAERASIGEPVLVLPEDAAELLITAPAHLIFPDFAIPILLKRGIRTIKQTNDMNFEELKAIVGDVGCAVQIRNCAMGIDRTPVGTYDHWHELSFECEVMDKFRNLLHRLLCLAEENNRTPLAIEVSVRQYDPLRNSNFKESKIRQIPSCLLPTLSRTNPESVSKLVSLIMGVFNSIVDRTRSFHLSLLGLAFVRFEERTTSRSVASCLLRKRDLSVQTITSISYEHIKNPLASQPRDTTPEPPDLNDELGPSEKKAKLDIVIKKRKFREDMELCSPSKLRVGDLNLNCDDAPSNGRSLIHC